MENPLKGVSYEKDFKDKGLATLGDSLANFIYSLALSSYTGKPTGGRVPNAAFAIALEMAGLREVIPRRTDKHGKGDIAEALLAYAWLQSKISVKEAVGILSHNFTDDVLHPYRNKEALGKAFGELFKVIKERLGL
ncbi:ribonuclease III family protein [Thermococcus sp. Bubb.Bath]|uniref:ribonuclease III family protein n=1 Tax=Thermococcus sp. Bubb.Bath TaxID=1638242 RepID=UPI001439B874|nr:ribonuclease III family protein [Thermococcus sp. Bubb.Bath]NJF24119.1 hypothetical protein [Thermococcus sp. Bubb.Bath]